MKEKQKAIKIWAFTDAPKEYQNFSREGGNLIAFCPTDLYNLYEAGDHPVIARLSEACFIRKRFVVSNGSIYVFVDF